MNSIVRLTPLLLVLLAVLCGPAGADTLLLKDGREFEGKLVSDSGGVVKFKTPGGVLSFPSSQVERVEKGATPADEYKKREKALDENDIEGRLALARWCREEKLFSQRKKLLAAILKLCPDHPGVRKENGQAWRDGKWVKASDVESTPVKAGKVSEIPGTLGKVAVPEGWERKDSAKAVTATGPNNYAAAPRLTIGITARKDPTQAFPQQDGWVEPEAVTAAGLSGLKSRRDIVENQIGSVEWMAVLSGSDYTVVVGLRTLQCESEDYGPALGVALESLEFAAPPADYVNTHYHYQLNLPRPKEEWEGGEDDEHDLVLVRRSGDVTDFAMLMIVTGNPGKEFEDVQSLYDSLVRMMKESGDIEKEEDITLAGKKGKLLQGTYLEDGIPVRSVAILVVHGKRNYCIHFQNHEYGGEKTGHALKTVLETFRFTE